MINLLEEQQKAHNENKAYALVTIVKTQGTTPRNIGSKMMVFEDGSVIGTIGGETPMEIAFSILSEMQKVRYKKCGQSLKFLETKMV